MQIVTLSENAVATLRFLVKGWHFPIREQDLPAYQELVDAGIMEPDGKGDYGFTNEGMEHRAEILEREADRIERERYEPPDAGNLSEGARELLRACIAGPYPEGDEANRPAYRELIKARIMIPMGSFSKGDDCVFRFTYWGYKRRYESSLDVASEAAYRLAASSP